MSAPAPGSQDHPPAAGRDRYNASAVVRQFVTLAKQTARNYRPGRGKASCMSYKHGDQGSKELIEELLQLLTAASGPKRTSQPLS
jgi:hypothetical protein